MAQNVEIDDSSVTESYLIQLNDNTLLKGEINKVTPDSIFLRLEFLGDVSISKKSNFIVEIDGGSTFRGELLESSNDSLLFDLIGLTNVWIENKNIRFFCDLKKIPSSLKTYFKPIQFIKIKVLNNENICV